MYLCVPPCLSVCHVPNLLDPAPVISGCVFVRKLSTSQQHRRILRISLSWSAGPPEELQQKKMARYKSEIFDELEGERADFTDEEFARLEQYMERRGRATAPATVAPMENAPAPSISIGMFMPSTILELRGRENLEAFLKRFRTWACVSRCVLVLDSEIVVKTSGTPPLAELERLHERSLVENSLKAWQALTKAL